MRHLAINSSKLLIVFSCLLCLCLQKVKSQDNRDSVKKWTASLQGMASRYSVIDKNFSALPYSGNYFGASSFVSYQKKRVIHALEFDYSNGILKTNFQNQSTQINLCINYANIYQLGALASKSAIKFYGGGSLNILYANRKYESFTNNNESYELATSLSASFKVVFMPKNLNSKFYISNCISLPFISAIQQPALGSEQPDGNLSGDQSKRASVFSSQKIVSIADFFRVKNSLSLSSNLTVNKKISLIYANDYYHIKSQREVKQSRHNVGLSYSYLF